MPLPQLRSLSRTALLCRRHLTIRVSPFHTNQRHRLSWADLVNPNQPVTENVAPTQISETIAPIDQLLATPTWSVSALGQESELSADDELDHEELLQLLRLSALPQPITQNQSMRYRAELLAHLRFVRDVQSVETDGIEPLVCIRNETHTGLHQNTIRLDDLEKALSRECARGKCGRPRRQTRDLNACPEEEWDVFGASKNVVTMNGDKYFVVWHKSPRTFKDGEIERDMTPKDDSALSLN